jgi:hypothetical protein
LIFILISIALLAGVGNGILAQITDQKEGFSSSSFITGFVGALIVQSLIIGVILILAYRWPKLSAILIFQLVLGSIFVLPSYFEGTNWQETYQVPLVIFYIILAGLYLLAGVMLFRKPNESRHSHE